MKLSYKFFIAFFILLLMIPVSADAEMIDQPQIKIQTLNKSTARKVTLEGRVGQTIEYGSLFIKIQACRKSEPLDTPENAAFLQIWEVPIGKDKSEWAFSGWMFSSSPAVSAMDHAVYDVWVLECFDENAEKAKPKNKVIVNDVEIDDTIIDEPASENEESELSDDQVVEDEIITDEASETLPTNNQSEDSAETIEKIENLEQNENIIRAEPFDTMIDDISNYE